MKANSLYSFLLKCYKIFFSGNKEKKRNIKVVCREGYKNGEGDSLLLLVVFFRV